MVAREASRMSPLEIYAFFGVPAMFLAIGLG